LDSAALLKNFENYISTMQTLSFEEINAVMEDPHIQHYISSLHGCINAGKVVWLNVEVELTISLRSKVASILRKQELPSSGFLSNFYVAPRKNGIIVPQVSIPWKRMYI
jgi:hypothetical protein